MCQLVYGSYLSVEHNYGPRYPKAMCHPATGRAVLGHYILKTRWDHQGWHATQLSALLIELSQLCYFGGRRVTVNDVGCLLDVMQPRNLRSETSWLTVTYAMGYTEWPRSKNAILVANCTTSRDSMFPISSLSRDWRAVSCNRAVSSVYPS